MKPKVRRVTTDECPFEKAERLAVEAVKDPGRIPEYDKAVQKVQALEFGSKGLKGNFKMSQTEKILKHMREAGHITQRQAMMDYSIQSLTRRICDLQEKGHRIHKERRKHPVTGQEYTRYSLA